MTKASFIPKSKLFESTELEVSVFPNPSSENTWIRINGNKQSGSLQIFDITGRLVHSESIAAGGNSLIELPNDVLTTGSYVILAQIGSEKRISKLVKH